MRVVLLLLLLSCRAEIGIRSRAEVAPVEEVCCTHAELVHQTLVGGAPGICVVSERLAMIIVAQARWETGDFKSKLFREHNNAFGMMSARRRPTTSLGPLAWAEGRPGYASYPTVQDSALDLLLWLEICGISGLPTDVTARGPKAEVRWYIRTIKSKKYFTDNLRHYCLGTTFYYVKYNPVQKPL